MENTSFLIRFRLSSTLKQPMEATVYDACFVAVFKSLRFHLPTLDTEHFQNAPLSKPFSKTSVFISVHSSYLVYEFSFETYWCGRGLK